MFAVKRLHLYKGSMGINEEVVKSLKNEIDILKNFEHENIVKYLGSEICENKFCIYLE